MVFFGLLWITLFVNLVCLFDVLFVCFFYLWVNDFGFVVWMLFVLIPTCWLLLVSMFNVIG